MAVNNDSFYKYQEHNAQSGYRSAWLVKEQNAEKYSLLVAAESVPSVFGTQDSFEFDLMNMPTKGKVPGKISLEDKEVTILHTRDNVYRLDKLKDKVLDFISMDSQFVGYKYTGTLSYKVNDAQGEVLKGTITISPMSADPNPIYDCRPLVEETLCFAMAIPDTVKANDEIDASVIQNTASVSYSFAKINSDGTESVANDAFTPTGSKIRVGASASGLYVIKASATGYASWFTTVYVG